MAEETDRKPRANNPDGLVAHAILALGATAPTHADLADAAGCSLRAVGNAVTDLAPAGLLAGGRPAKLGPGMGLVVGVSLGGESVRAGVVDANGELCAQTELDARPGQLKEAPHRVLARIREAVYETLARASRTPKVTLDSRGALALRGVAVAWPSPVSRDKFAGGTALRHEGWRQPDRTLGRRLKLTEHVARALGPPFGTEACHALNDVNAQALAVAFDKARKQAITPIEDDDRWRVLMVVRVGGGLGTAVVIQAPFSRRRLAFIDSRLIEGTNGYAGELGHLSVERSVIAELNKASPFASDQLRPLNFAQAICSCGRRGHLEAFASGTALARRLRASGYGADEDGDTALLRSVFAGPLDGVQVHAIRDVGRLIGRALASPILMLDPWSITFTGSVANVELEKGLQIERGFWANAVGDTVDVDPLTAEQGRFAGVRGAALAVMRRQVHRRLEEIVNGQYQPTITLRATQVDAINATR